MKRIIQVGVGGMGTCWTDRIAESDEWEAAAYVDTNPAHLKAAAARHGLPKSRCFATVGEALRRVKADALLDVAPQQFRRGVCEAAIGAGLHVMSEKPLADNLKNAKAIVACAAKHKRIYMVAQNYRYQPVVQTMKRWVSEGRLGAVGYAGVTFHKGPHFGGFREEMAYPLVLDMSIHHVDMMRCIFDADVTSVSAASTNAPWNWNKGDATIMAQLELSNGIAVNYFGSWVSTGWETPWNAHWRIEGSKGVLLCENDKLAFSATPDRKRAIRLVPCPRVHQARLLELFGRAIETGEEPETSGRRNLNSLATTYAIVRAAEAGRRIHLSEMLR